eukprot:comp19051_c0_seq1/m.35266 comp19051_c0_seq1/g.35266  ORF comp19051_c0_seq1/g.35266 comp19051_c0_seq1/m.35266 type:complete len:544 (+) comp19051_c0_seq1:535-2166(+)
MLTGGSSVMRMDSRPGMARILSITCWEILESMATAPTARPPWAWRPRAKEAMLTPWSARIFAMAAMKPGRSLFFQKRATPSGARSIWKSSNWTRRGWPEGEQVPTSFLDPASVLTMTVTEFVWTEGTFSWFSLTSRPISSAMVGALIMLTGTEVSGEMRPLRTAVLSKWRLSLSRVPRVRRVMLLILPWVSSCEWREPRRSERSNQGWSSLRECISERRRELTTPATARPSNALTTWVAISLATLSCASPVEAPRCGVAMTLGWLKSSTSSFGGGSCSKTSRPAPATLPLWRARRRACSSMMPPRAQLMKRTPSLHFFMDSSLKRLRVSSVSGQWRVIKSEFVMSSSSLTGSMPYMRAISLLMSGSNPMVRMPRLWHVAATLRPMWPRPRMPIVFPATSTPVYFLRSHFPAFIEACAAGTFLASDMSSEIVISAADAVFPPGVFMTMIPRLVAASMSTLSTPVPARPMICSFFPRSMMSLVTVVPDRTISASYSGIIRSISSFGTFSIRSTTYPSFWKMSTQACSIGSLIRIRRCVASEILEV